MSSWRFSEACLAYGLPSGKVHSPGGDFPVSGLAGADRAHVLSWLAVGGATSGNASRDAAVVAAAKALARAESVARMLKTPDAKKAVLDAEKAIQGLLDANVEAPAAAAPASPREWNGIPEERLDALIRENAVQTRARTPKAKWEALERAGLLDSAATEGLKAPAAV